MGGVTVRVGALAGVVLMRAVLATAIVCRMGRRDSSEGARLRAALAPERKA